MDNEQNPSLYRLIHGLTKAEKKHFKLYARYSKAAAGAAYLRLFDIIERQKQYNEGKIIAKGIVRKERIRAQKHYLYHLILESLQVFRIKGDDVDTKLSHLLECARMMREKGLEKEEMNFLEKAKKLAIENERWGATVDSILAERKALIRLQDFKNLELANAKSKSIFANLDNLRSYMKINDEIFTTILKAGSRKNTPFPVLEKFKRDPHMQSENKAFSVSAKMAFFDSLFNYYLFMDDLEAGYRVLSRQLQVIEQNEGKVSSFSRSVILNNLAIAQQKLGKYNEVLPTILKHRSLVWRSKKERSLTLLYSYINETNYHLVTGDFENSESAVRGAEDYLKEFRPDYTWQLNALYYNIAYLYFGKRNYHKALQWTNAIINHPKMIFREDLQTAARILQILSHLEMNTPDIITRLLESAHRYLVTRKQRYKAEEHFLAFIGKTFEKGVSGKPLKEELNKFNSELKQIAHNAKESKLLEYFDLISWIESRIENVSFSEVVKRTLPLRK